MAYPIQKVHKAHYVLMNIECDKEALGELEHAFKFNDAVLRHLIVATTDAKVAPSPMMKEEKARSLSRDGEVRSESRTEVRTERTESRAPLATEVANELANQPVAEAAPVADTAPTA